MTTAQKLALANDLHDTFQIDMFDEEGYVNETVLDALVYCVQKWAGPDPAQPAQKDKKT